MGLVGLYACNVRRLEVRKRKPANFLGFAPVFLWDAALAFACIVFVASLLLFVCFACVACVGCGFLSLRMIATKRKGAPLLVLPLFVRGLWVCYMLINSSK